MHTVHGKKFFFMVFRWGQSLVQLFSISFYVISFICRRRRRSCHFADYTTPYSANKTIDLVIKENRTPFRSYFSMDLLELHENDNVSVDIDNSTFVSERKNDMLGIILDLKISFEDCINNLCKKASRKLNGLARVAPFMFLKKRKNDMKAFLTSQFGDFLLAWMIHTKALNNKENPLHKGVLRITYSDK